MTELERAVKLYRAAAEPGACDDHHYMTACVDLATARLRAGDLQAAETAVSPVLALPCPRRISELAHSFIRVRAELATGADRDTAAARILDAQIGQFCAETIATHLHDAPVTV